MLTYDEATRTLFTSDLFGGFTPDPIAWADEAYEGGCAAFHEHYLCNREALEYALLRIEKLARDEGIDRVCPQHGAMFPGDQLPAYCKLVRDVDVGQAVRRLAAKHGLDLPGKRSGG